MYFYTSTTLITLYHCPELLLYYTCRHRTIRFNRISIIKKFRGHNHERVLSLWLPFFVLFWCRCGWYVSAHIITQFAIAINRKFFFFSNFTLLKNNMVVFSVFFSYCVGATNRTTGVCWTINIKGFNIDWKPDIFDILCYKLNFI